MVVTDVISFEGDTTLRGLVKAHAGHSRRCLPAPAFTRQSQDLTFPDLKTDTVHRFDSGCRAPQQRIDEITPGIKILLKRRDLDDVIVCRLSADAIQMTPFFSQVAPWPDRSRISSIRSI